MSTAVAIVNNQAFAKLKNELERSYPSQWIIIADGKFLGAANTLEEFNHLASTARHRLVMQMGLIRAKEVELGWQMTFA